MGRKMPKKEEIPSGDTCMGRKMPKKEETMNRHDELLEAYCRRKNIGHVLNLCTDFDFSLVPAIQERPVNPDGSEGTGRDWFAPTGNMCRNKEPAW